MYSKTSWIKSIEDAFITKCRSLKRELNITFCYFLFSDVLADNGRLTLTGDVIAAFGKMMSAHRGEVLCSVTTAQV